MFSKKRASNGKEPLNQPTGKIRRVTTQIEEKTDGNTKEKKEAMKTVALQGEDLKKSGKVCHQEDTAPTATSLLEINSETSFKLDSPTLGEKNSCDQVGMIMETETVFTIFEHEEIEVPDLEVFPFAELLPELQSHILHFLSKRDLLILRYTSRYLQELVDKIAPFVYVPMAGMLAILEKRSISKYQKLSSIDLIKAATRYFQSRRFPGKMGFQLNELGDFEQRCAESLPQDLCLLRINKCRLEEKVLRRLPPFLNILILNNCGIKNDDLKYLPLTLKRLTLGDCKDITDDAMKEFPEGLQKLTLAGAEKLTNAALKMLPPSLATLEITLCKSITDEGVKSLPKTIRRLSLTSCANISSKCFISLPPKLEYLDLIHTSAKLSEDFKNLPISVQDMRFCSCTGVAKDTAQFVPRTLKRLSLIHCVDLNSDIMKLLPVPLNFLSLYGCATDQLLEHLQPSITELDLSECQRITDACVQYFPENMKKLFLRHTPITDEGIISISKKCPKLEELDIGSCAITDEALRHLPPSLTYANLWGCEKITSAGVKSLHQRLKYCSTNVAYVIMKELFVHKFGS